VQDAVARALGASVASLTNWEKGRAEPEARHYPAIIRFLGYDPLPAGKTLGDRVRAKRLAEGLTQRQLGEKLGIDPGTVQAWEAGAVTRRYPRLVRLVEEFLEGQS
jgi:transcriptional regulator with XRE-family HTH domain